jgi:hypothetical protein
VYYCSINILLERNRLRNFLLSLPYLFKYIALLSYLVTQIRILYLPVCYWKNVRIKNLKIVILAVVFVGFQFDKNKE